jgi:DNA topoisomerase II
MNYIVEEGLQIEPNFYVPVIPLVLANGVEGIGTGWATFIPQFSPIDLINNIRKKLNGE